jgi:hypothetical protein
MGPVRAPGRWLVPIWGVGTTMAVVEKRLQDSSINTRDQGNKARAPEVSE